MLLAIAIILLIFWVLAFFAFHVAGGLIHVLLLAALVFLTWHTHRSRTHRVVGITFLIFFSLGVFVAANSQPTMHWSDSIESKISIIGSGVGFALIPVLIASIICFFTNRNRSHDCNQSSS
jgi:hypothetical protein